MRKALIFLTTGFEEIEALATVDILRRGDVDVKTISLTDQKTVVGSHGIPVVADLLFSEADCSATDMLILPGGTPKINDHEGLKKQVKAFSEADKDIAAICAAPMVLGGLGLLKGKSATCYPGFEKYLDGATLKTQEAVVVDGKIVTGRGPGLTFDFALQLLEVLAGKAKRDEVAKGLLLA
ncbi:4-methyl-5(b-hydroxyethyl)-thiazole monophosphate biosynthesis [Dysgonomonas alginatilytica]|uniref:4-methyl-5(B-hydroxyethyl)-thiazole monophosphate biosynthesis n=1 Tax=Dysgonomonas alginatilytica TaxID=1605892 RepID=A0A2V3PME1_9BACT|nr:DJ-1 family glyoxalase III [Dysgonomonas alginatilytica]PXV62657.1 4-methyl-5(b-hydroxyethyl)-thiazole monophosphate biosynthesis [Dysgonomonas alginatilytica]